MKRLLLFLALFSAAASGHGETIGQWTFNSSPPDSDKSTGTITPTRGIGSAALLNGITATFSDGSTNDPAPSTDDSGWQTTHYPPQGTSNKTAGVQFNVSTVGYSNIVVRWDHRVTSTASKYFRLQFSSDGGNTFTDYPSPVIAQTASSTASYYEAQTNSLAAFPAVNDNPNFAFRIVSEWESTALGTTNDGYAVLSATSGYSTAGNVRFDFVTITGMPLPGANTAPVIYPIGDQIIRVNHSTGPLAFTVLDAEDAASNLILSATTSDPTIIAPADIIFGGNSSSRTVQVSAGAQDGSSLVAVWVTDTGGKSSSSSFTVTVLPANTAPVISVVPATNTLINVPVSPLTFTVADAETAAANLTLSGTSANPALVANSNIFLGGTGSNRTVAVSPATGQIGVAPITVTVSDGTNTASSTFGVMVRPATNVLLFDPFEYADGSVITNSGSLWANHTGAIGECQVTHGQLELTGSQTEDVAALLAGGPYNKNFGTVLYASFKVNFQSLPKTTPDYFAAYVAGSSQVARLFAGSPTNAASGTLRLGVANGSSTNTLLPSDLETNTAYTIVTRYNIDTATTTFWLNPAAEADPSLTATDPQTPVNISSFLFREGSGLGGALILIDDVKIGLSFAAVTTTNAVQPSPIPLNLQRTANNIVLTWTNASFSLQAAGAVTGPFTNLPGATSPCTNPITGSAKFFRLRAN